MDVIVQREALLKPLQAVSGVVEKKQTLPILSNVLLDVRGEQLLLTGTDLEIELISFVNLISKQSDGVVTVSAKKLFDIFRALPEGIEARLTLEHNHLIVRAGESCFKLNTLPAEDFPKIENCEFPVSFSISKYRFKQLLAKTYFAMGQQDVRHYLNGAFLDISNQNIRCVAADGHRMALSTFSDSNLGSSEAKVILPRKSVLELIRMLSGESDEVIQIYLAEGRFKLNTSDFIFSSKLIMATYPDYTRLIPKGKTIAIGERDAIKNALARASILSNEKFRGVRFQFEKNKLRISANNSDQEHAEEDIAMEYDGDHMEIAFNVAYLLDVVSSISDKMIRCIFSGPNDGVLIEAVEQDHSLYVIMPMRL